MASHEHVGRVCKFRTKRECDEWLTNEGHYHPGQPCEKEFQPSKSKRGQTNKIATCVLSGPRGAEYRRLLSAKVRGEEPPVCIACEFGGPHHGGPHCTRRTNAFL